MRPLTQTWLVAENTIKMAAEQANYDLISLLEEPPIAMFQERAMAVSSTARPFSPLIPPSWTVRRLLPQRLPTMSAAA